MNKYIQYDGCKVFPNESRAGRMTEEINSKGKIEKCCLGATEEPTEWSSICKECFECPKYIENVVGRCGMKNNHKSAKLDALLFKAVKIVFWDGSTEKGLLYDHDSAIKYTGRIACNTPYFLLLYDGTMIGFYKTHVKKIIYNGSIEIKGG